MDFSQLQHILDRFHPGYGKRVDCGEGWYQLIFDCDAELAAIDPDYQVLQIKQKFGSLRFYCASNDESKSKTMSDVTLKYEQLSLRTCELTGKPGVIMKKGLWFKTLDPELGDAAGYLLA
jgi:hypothetical protein